VRLRAPTEADAEACADLVIKGDIADLGEADYTLADLRNEWAAGDFDLGQDAVIAQDGEGRIAGYAALRRSKPVAVVDPDRAGEGFGTALLDWCEAYARAAGLEKCEQAIGERNVRGRELLLARGYQPVRSYWRMDRALAAEPEVPGLRAPELPADTDRLFALSEAAFARNADHEPATPTAFADHHLRPHDLDLALSRVAERAGAIAGVALVRRWPDGIAYIDLLAVDPAAWGQGIGGGLLRGVFAAAAAAGLERVQLGVASDNAAATRLYERAGMRVRFRVDAYERPLPD
jgi:ribosomal protein S18 acetylase RimI-like enzyme